ncbi:hypothetical protein [Streptomyces sparsogenes]|uniref:hypothetical protein n=1 Tax=Streptomyces sparsogenes TaxID=67365 RepID=UPI0033DD95EB
MGVFDGSLYVIDIREANGSESERFTGSAGEAQQIVDEARDDGARAVSVRLASYAVHDVDTGMGFGDWYDD